jgi:hypothetical protein
LNLFKDAASLSDLAIGWQRLVFLDKLWHVCCGFIPRAFVPKTAGRVLEQPSHSRYDVSAAHDGCPITRDSCDGCVWVLNTRNGCSYPRDGIDVPDLVAMVQSDLLSDEKRTFGQRRVHQQLSLEQMDALRKGLPDVIHSGSVFGLFGLFGLYLDSCAFPCSQFVARYFQLLNGTNPDVDYDTGAYVRIC